MQRLPMGPRGEVALVEELPDVFGGGAKLVGIDPAKYLKTAVEAAFAGQLIPLPHEIAKQT